MNHVDRRKEMIEGPQDPKERASKELLLSERDIFLVATLIEDPIFQLATLRPRFVDEILTEVNEQKDISLESLFDLVHKEARRNNPEWIEEWLLSDCLSHKLRPFNVLSLVDSLAPGDKDLIRRAFGREEIECKTIDELRSLMGRFRRYT